MMFEETVRILSETAVGRTPRWLDVRDVPVGRTEDAKKRLRVHRACTDLDVERLLQRTPARRPEFRQLENQVLKRQRRISRNTRTDFRSFSRCIAISSRCADSISFIARRDSFTSASANGLDERAVSRNALASGDRRPSGS